MQPPEQPPEGPERNDTDATPEVRAPAGEPDALRRGAGETPALPLLLPVVAFGGLIVVLVIAAFLAGSRAEERAREQYREGVRLLEEGERAHALRLLERAAHQDPELTAARCRLGELLLAERRRADAAPHLEACLQGLGEGAAAERERVEEMLRRARAGRKGTARPGR
jgi:thioredoxin-like negative regulator of GroEL